MILVAGALLATALGASLLAGRLRVPGLVLFLGLGMAVGSDGFGLDRLRRLRARARRSASSRSALILFEGGLAAGFGEIRPVLGPALVARDRRHDPHRGRSPGSPPRGCSTSPRCEGMLRRLDRRRHRRRRDLRGAARLDAAAAAGAHARGRGRHQRPGRGHARDRLHRLDPEPGLRHRRHGAAVRRRSSAIGAGRSALAVGSRRVRALQRAAARPPPACTRSRRWRPRRWRSARADVAARLRLPRRLPLRAWCSAAATSRRGGRSSTFHDGLAWVAQLGMFLTLGLLVFPSELGDVVARGHRARARRRRSSRGRSARPRRAPSAALACRERLVLGWAGLRGAVPVVLATFPVIDGRRRRARRSSTSCSSPSCSARVLQGATFEPFAQLARRDERRAGAARAAAGRRRRAPARRRGRRVRRAAPATRSPGARCASSGCRATRC